MEIINVLRKKTYLAIAIVSAIFMFFFLPYVQTFGVATDLWYKIIPRLNLILFIIFIALFGMFVSYQIYKIRGPKVCRIKRSTATGALGTAFGFIIGVCPACIGFAGLFLPIGIVTTLVVFGPFFLLISISLMVFSIYINGGFKKKILSSS